jgi:benzoate/toluate 1,2-dioxygenase reductase subunit
MSYKIALSFEDNVTRFIHCRPGETVADASYRVGINIPLDCREGACGTCKVFCEIGHYEGGLYVEDALTGEEAARGYALACQMKPTSDLALRIAASSDACKTKATSCQAQLSEVKRISESTFGLSLKVGTSQLGFLPGQYVNITVPRANQQRSYSFSSTPGASDVSFLIRDVPGGLMSTFLRQNAEIGMPIEFTGPFGSFYLREINRPLLFLAGGTGLAPFLAMLGTIADTACAQPIHMVYGVTRDVDLVEVDRLEKLSRQIPGFTFSCCVACEGSRYPRRGYVTRHIELNQLNGGDVDIYVCGPPTMVGGVRDFLAEQAIAPANLYVERFSPSSEAPRGIR